MNVAMLLSCGSFEGFFGGIQGHDKDRYLREYRNDWAWYYGAGLLENGIKPILYIPALHEDGRYETDTGIAVRFLPIAAWYRPVERPFLKMMIRRSRLSLYLDDRLNAAAFMKPLRAALEADAIDHLYVQDYWHGRFDHIVEGVDVPVSGADHGGTAQSHLKHFKRDAFAKAALIYVQTPDEARLVERYGGRARLQPNGCDVERFSPGLDPRDKPTILTVGRLTNGQKRTTDLVRALALLPPDWSLDIIGSGPDREMIVNLVKELGLGERVRFHGFLDQDAVLDHMRRCGVYAMPSSNEGLAMAALEAMGCEASVVFSRIRSFEQLVEHGHNGTLFPVGDVNALAAALREAFEHRRDRGARARRTMVERFDMRRLYRELADTLRETTPGQRGGTPEHGSSAAAATMAALGGR